MQDKELQDLWKIKDDLNGEINHLEDRLKSIRDRIDTLARELQAEADRKRRRFRRKETK